MCPLAFSHLKFGLILRSLACLVKSGSSMAVWGGAVGGAAAALRAPGGGQCGVLGVLRAGRGADRVPPRGHLRHGPGAGRQAAGAGAAEAQGGGRQRHAQAGGRQHQRAHHHDGGEGSRHDHPGLRY